MGNSLNIVARVLMSQLFIISGIGKITAYGGPSVILLRSGYPCLVYWSLRQ